MIRASGGFIRLGTFAWDLSLGDFRLGLLAWELFSLGIFCLGSWGPEAGGTGLLRLGEPADGSRVDLGDRVVLLGLFLGKPVS